jgi:hypothetical protein
MNIQVIDGVKLDVQKEIIRSDYVYSAGIDNAKRVRLIKQDHDFNTLWSLQPTKARINRCSIACDKQDNVYLLTTKDRSKAVIDKFSSAGKHLWKRDVTIPGCSWRVMIDDAQNNIVFAGHIEKKGMYLIHGITSEGTPVWLKEGFCKDITKITCMKKDSAGNILLYSGEITLMIPHNTIQNWNAEGIIPR